MHHHSVTPFGARPVSACLMQGQRQAKAPSTTQDIDKWALFHQLRKARAGFGLSKGSMVVLNALLSFHPSPRLADGGPLVVFPSNAALSDRAHGMAESTLRRHLAALVAAGLICRNDSPNGKRFALRARAGAVMQAYGFDLRPLLVQAHKIAALAEAAEDAALALKLARHAVVTRLRDIHKLVAYAAELGLDLPALPPLAPVQTALRRKLDLASLHAMDQHLAAILSQIEAHLPAEEPAAEELVQNHTQNSGQNLGQTAVETSAEIAVQTKELGGADSQNGRHQQNSQKEIYDLEPAAGDAPPAKTALPRLTLDLLLKACPDVKPYAQGGINTWRDLVRTADMVSPMMGISPQAWHKAKAVMGAETAAAVVAAILQRVADIRVPGGYLRKLTQEYALGALSVPQIIMALLNGKRGQAA